MFVWRTCREKAISGAYVPGCSDSEPASYLMLGDIAMFQIKLQLQLFVVVTNSGL